MGLEKMISLRTEKQEDYKAVEALIKEAFAEAEYSDHQEHALVARLRKAPEFIPELSIVAQLEDNLVGYILLTPIQILEGNTTHESLALAPVAVLPARQRKGIGAALIQYAHEKAAALGYTSIILLGHEDYYPKVGYKPASQFGIQAPFDVPDQNFMAIELVEGNLANVRGTVQYPAAFGI